MAVTQAGRIGLTVSAEDVTAYRRDGAVLIKGVLSGAELELLERGLEQIHGTPSDMFSRFEAPGGCGETMVDQFPSLHSRFLRQLLEEAPVAELAARLMGVPSAQLILDQMFYKRKGRIVPTPWHQDTAFLRVRGHDMARVWLSRDPSPRDVTVQVVRGSHLWNVVFDTPGAASDVVKAGEGSGFTYNGIGNSELPPVPDIEGHRDSFDILGFEVEPGDAVVFHGNVLHGAAGATTIRMRAAPSRRCGAGRSFATTSRPATRYHCRATRAASRYPMGHASAIIRTHSPSSGANLVPDPVTVPT